MGGLTSLPKVILRLVQGQPLQFGLVSSSHFRRDIELGQALHPDVIVAIHIRVAFQVPETLRPRGLAFLIDSYGRSYSTYREPITGLGSSTVYGFEAKRMSLQEQRICAEFGRTAILSWEDQVFLSKQGCKAGKVVRLPYPVDVQYFADTVRHPDLTRPIFAFVGRLNYLPNKDAAVQLITRIWPLIKRRIPLARLRIIGARPDGALRRLIADKGGELCADVADIRPALSDIAALIVPMRIGGGVQTKILEAMAARVPVVCSGFASDGIGATPDQHALIADTPEAFADQAIRLVKDQSLSSLVGSAWDWVSSQYSREQFDSQLLPVLQVLQASR